MVKLPVSDPSAWRVSGRDSDSFTRIFPLGVFIDGTMCRNTSVPRSAATSPPFSIFCGGRPV